MAPSTLLRDAFTDAAFSIRLLARRKGFAAVSLLTLALGIGAPTAVFSIVNAVLLRPLPYAESNRLLRFRMEVHGGGGGFAFDALPASAALQWVAESSALSDIALFNDRALTLAGADGPARLDGISTTPNLFTVLGVAPARGRLFSASDADLRTVVLSDTFWRRYLGADPSIVGTTINLDGDPWRVTAVMPPGFGFPTPEALFWVPQPLDASEGRGLLIPAIGRLKPGATIDDAIAEGRRYINQADPRVKPTLIARTVQEQMVGGVRRVLWVFMASVALVSVIAVVNIALLLMTRGASRGREFALRLALGAGRGRLARQLFIEGATLAIAGGAIGIALSGLGLTMLMKLVPGSLPRLHEVTIDGRVLLFALAVTLGASIVFGVLSAGRLIALDSLRRLAGPANESRLVEMSQTRRPLNMLAAAELALTTVLLVGAGLLLHSFVSTLLVPQGFDPEGATAMQINLPQARYPTAEARLAFHARMLESLRSLPGVESAGLATAMPNRQATGRFAYSATGIELFPDPVTRPITEVRMVTEGFLEAAGVALLSGRTFTAADVNGGEPVIVITRAFARRYFPGAEPIGRTLFSESGNRRVIGIVGDVRPAAEGATESISAYIPLRQSADLLAWHASMNIVIRGAKGTALVGAARSIISSLDSALPLSNVRSLDDEIASLSAAPRFMASVLAIFAAIALVMASIGVYGVMAYSASQRTREVGVRIALGASRRQVLSLMMRDGVIVVAAGLGAGLVLAVWLARALVSLLHEVAPTDPIALGCVAALLGVTGLTAAFLPARRATRQNILTSLRNQ